MQKLFYYGYPLLGSLLFGIIGYFYLVPLIMAQHNLYTTIFLGSIPVGWTIITRFFGNKTYRRKAGIAERIVDEIEFRRDPAGFLIGNALSKTILWLIKSFMKITVSYMFGIFGVIYYLIRFVHTFISERKILK